MQITLYGGTYFDRSGKIRWLLEELGVKYQDEWLKTDEDYESFLKISPLGRKPAIVLDDQLLIESGAIGEYLADVFSPKGLAPAIESADRGAYLQWLNLGISIGSVSARIQIIEDIPEGAVKTQKSQRLFEELTDTIEIVGNALNKKQYLLGSFTAADIFIGYHTYYASLWPELNEIIERNANVSQYLKRLKSRPAAVASKVFTFEANSGTEKDEP